MSDHYKHLDASMAILGGAFPETVARLVSVKVGDDIKSVCWATPTEIAQMGENLLFKAAEQCSDRALFERIKAALQALGTLKQ